jgi:surface polysaccharide O-acyltransferase-like enzyme
MVIFGWCEVLLGAIGSIPSLDTVRMYLVTQHKYATGYYKGLFSGFSDELYLEIIRSVSMCTFPLFFVLISGILTLRLSPSAKRINTVFLPLLLIVEAVCIYQSSTLGMQYNPFFMQYNPFYMQYKPLNMQYNPFYVCLYAGIAIFQIWFFTRPKVKEQFK